MSRGVHHAIAIRVFELHQWHCTRGIIARHIASHGEILAYVFVEVSATLRVMSNIYLVKLSGSAAAVRLVVDSQETRTMG